MKRSATKKQNEPLRKVVSRFVPESSIEISPADQSLIAKEVVSRIAKHEKSTGSVNRGNQLEDRLNLIVSAEMAFHRYMELDPAGISTGTLKDSSRDVILKNGETVWKCQVKTWATDKASLRLYIPAHVTVRADVIVGIAQKAPGIFRLVGFIMREDFNARCEPAKMGAQKFKAVGGDELTPVHVLYLDFNGPRGNS